MNWRASVLALFGVLLLVVAIPSAAFDIESMPTPEMQKRYDGLTHELRCMQCQNQSIADSPVGLAEDLRRPWEKPAPQNRLTPARVRRGFRNIRGKTTLPARAPKPSRPGPGRPPGSRNHQPAPHYDVGKTVKRDRTIAAHQRAKG